MSTKHYTTPWTALAALSLTGTLTACSAENPSGIPSEPCGAGEIRCGETCVPSGTECTDGSGGSTSIGSTNAGSTSTTGSNNGEGRRLAGVCYLVCSSSSLDDDGDGWAFEGDVSCIVEDSSPYRMGTPCNPTSSASTSSSGTGGASAVTTTSATTTSAATSATTGSSTTGASTTGKFVGNITTDNVADTEGKSFASYWNQITPENAGKWGSVQFSTGAAFNWGPLDAIYDYAEQHGIVFKQHAFVWGSQQPSGTVNEESVRTWMREFCSRYPNTPLIDVVNEPPPHTEPSYSGSIGGGTNSSWQWIINSFEWAREACPNSVLILNDYNNIEWPNDNDHFLGIVQTLQAAGAPIDAIGAQAHDLDHGQVTLNTVKSLLGKLHDETGLPIYITEMDISTDDDNLQLSKYQEYFPYFYETSYIHGITIWGWIYGKTWSQAPQSGLVRSGSFRPAMTWLMQELGRPTN